MGWTSSARRRISGTVLVIGLIGVPALANGPAVGAQAAPGASTTVAVQPTPTPAHPGKPSIVGVVGDSITQSTGTGELSKENPKNNWATGWEVNSVAARAGVSTGNRYNFSANGDRMSDFAPQIANGKSGGSGDVAPLPANAGLVLVEFGGNDLCRDSVADMTSVATYRAQFVAGLNAVKTKAPDALVQVMSVPDIYNLWYIRGAPQNSTYHPESESDQASSPPYYNGARFYWDQSFFPCRSLLANPDSYAQADRDRRAAVRARTKEYNQVLFDECAKVLRCKYDDAALFNLTSNRVSPPDGPLLPQNQWRFVDGDISRNEGVGVALCPVQGVFAGGCGDHFHPSKQGQGKIADVAWTYGRNYADTTYPTNDVYATTFPREDGKWAGKATVRFGTADNAGVRGQEVRVHKADGTITPWTAYFGTAPDVAITDPGVTYVEGRTLDINGNMTASKVVKIDIGPAQAPTNVAPPTVLASESGLSVKWVYPPDDGGSPITSYRIEAYKDRPATPLGTSFTAPGSATTAPVPSPLTGKVVQWRVIPINAIGEGTPSFLTPPTVAPFATLGAFVQRQYADFAGRAPTGNELANAVNPMSLGTTTPAAWLQTLTLAKYWDGAYGGPTRLYKAYFLRLPDTGGLDYWARHRRAGQTLSSISQFFARSSEFKRRYGTLSDSAFVDKIYSNVFSRPPDQDGRAFWVKKLKEGWSRGMVMLQFSESPEYKRKTAGMVTTVELTRGMLGRGPTQAEVTARDASFATDGYAGVLTDLIGLASYRTRVF
jgi:lysophospholipase L1-like esterase